MTLIPKGMRTMNASYPWKEIPFTVFSLMFGQRKAPVFFGPYLACASAAHTVFFPIEKTNIRMPCTDGVLSLRAHDTALDTIAVQETPGCQNREKRRSVTPMKNLLVGKARSSILQRAKRHFRQL